MALPKLKKNEADVNFINLQTGEVDCTYSKCYEKFVPHINYEIMTPASRLHEPIRFELHCHKCPDCGREIASSKDKKANVHSRRDAQLGGGEVVTDPAERAKALESLQNFRNDRREDYRTFVDKSHLQKYKRK